MIALRTAHWAGAICILCSFAACAADTPALDVVTVAPGEDYYQGSSYCLGWRFTTNTDVQVTALGFYDDLKDGIHGNHDCGIYDVVSQQLLATATVVPSDALTGFFRYHALATPVTLPAGRDYFVQAVTLTDKYANASPTISVDPTITFDGYAGDTGGVPSTVLHYPNGILSSTDVGNFGPSFLISNSSPPPFVLPLNSDNNPGLINSVVSYTFTASDAPNPALNYTFNFGDSSAPLTGSFTQGMPVTVTHTYTAYSDVGYPVSLTIDDGTNPPVTASTMQTVPMPSSTGAGVVNVALNAPAIVDPLDNLGVSVISSDGGVIQLGIDVSLLTRATYSVSTDFGDLLGRSSIVTGITPVHKYLNRGIYVATSIATNKVTGVLAGKGRITLALSASETGDIPVHVQNPRAGRTLPNNSPDIATKKIQGKFDFSGKKPDVVTYLGTIALPAGLDMSKPYEFWIAIGNIAVKTTIVKGKGTAPSVAGVLKSLAITSKVKKGAITAGGEVATINVTYSSKNTVSNGFDTEGISNKSTDLTPGKTTAPRKIQVAMLLDGVPYQSVTPVNFSLLKNLSSGSIAGPGKN